MNEIEKAIDYLGTHKTPHNALLLELLYDELRRIGCSWCDQYAGIVKSATYCPKCRRKLREEEE